MRSLAERVLFMTGLALLLTTAAAPASAEEAPQTWAVVVGVNEYNHEGVNNLKCAEGDARAFAETLEARCSVPSSHIWLLTTDIRQTPDRKASRTNIGLLLKFMTTRVRPGDTVYFFFSGHGMQLEDRSFLLTGDADYSSLRALQETALDTNELYGWLLATRASHIMIIVDACRSDPRRNAGAGGDARDLAGLLARDLTLVTVPSGQARSLPVSDRWTATVLSCKAGQSSYEWPEKGNGYFTWHLLAGLKGGAATPDGAITLRSLLEYVHAEVPKSMAASGLTPQIPWVEYKGPGEQLWLMSRTTARPVALSPSERAAVEKERQLLLAELEQLKKAADARAAQIQREAETKILAAVSAERQRGDKLREELSTRLLDAEKRAQASEARIHEVNGQVGAMRAQVEASRAAVADASRRSADERARAELALRQSQQALAAREEQLRVEHNTLVQASAEAEATRLAALNVTTSNAPLSATHTIAVSSVLTTVPKSTLPPRLEMIKQMGDRALLFNAGAFQTDRFDFDSVSNRLDPMAAGARLDSGQPIAVETPFLEMSGDIVAESLERPPTALEMAEAARYGRTHIETVVVRTWAELEQLNALEELTDVDTSASLSAPQRSMMTMMRTVEGHGPATTTTTSEVIPPTYERNAKGELAVKVAAHPGLRYRTVRPASGFSIYIDRVRANKGTEYRYVDRVSAFEAIAWLASGRPLLVRATGRGQAEVKSAMQLNQYIQMSR